MRRNLRDAFLTEAGQPQAVERCAEDVEPRGSGRWRGAPQLARVLGVAVRTVRVWVPAGRFPHLCELQLRRPVIGRKNGLFAGCEGSAQATATLLSLVGRCRLHGIDPWEWVINDEPMSQVTHALQRHGSGARVAVFRAVGALKTG